MAVCKEGHNGRSEPVLFTCQGDVFAPVAALFTGRGVHTVVVHGIPARLHTLLEYPSLQWTWYARLGRMCVHRGLHRVW